MTSSRLTIETVAAPAVQVVALSGDLTLGDTPRLLMTLTRAMQESPGGAVVCELSGLTAPTTKALLTVFPTALRRCGGWPNSSLQLAAPAPDVADQLRRMHMSRYLPVHPSVEAAMSDIAGLQESMRQQFRFPADTSGLRAARAAAMDLWPARDIPGGDDPADAVLLVTNELVSNAITHTAAPFGLSLAHSSDRALIAVTDDSRDEPILRPPRASETTGRGLQIIAGLSQNWGVRLVYPRGKTVWARVLTSTGSLS